jgi:hypothetical protein
MGTCTWADQTYDDVGLFWDYENIKIPRTCDTYLACTQLRSYLRHVGRMCERRVYYDSRKDAETQTDRVGLSASGFTLVDCPAPRKKKEVVDKKIIVDMMAFVCGRLDLRHRLLVVLISSDGDYAYALNRLRDFGVTTVVIHGPNIHPALLKAADRTAHWTHDILLVHALTTSDDDGGSTASVSTSSTSEDTVMPPQPPPPPPPRLPTTTPPLCSQHDVATVPGSDPMYGTPEKEAFARAKKVVTALKKEKTDDGRAWEQALATLQTSKQAYFTEKVVRKRATSEPSEEDGAHDEVPMPPSPSSFSDTAVPAAAPKLLGKRNRLLFLSLMRERQEARAQMTGNGSCWATSWAFDSDVGCLYHAQMSDMGDKNLRRRMFQADRHGAVKGGMLDMRKEEQAWSLRLTAKGRQILAKQSLLA